MRIATLALIGVLSLILSECTTIGFLAACAKRTMGCN
jgi:hypothetical protein